MLAPVVTLIIGFIGGVLTWHQLSLARHRFRLDLFDRRYKIYEATMRFLGEIVGNATFTDGQLIEFYRGTSDSVFLFGKDVVDHLESIRLRALKMRRLAHEFQNLPVGEHRSRLVELESVEFSWITDQLTALRGIFLPYLGFDTIRHTPIMERLLNKTKIKTTDKTTKEK